MALKISTLEVQCPQDSDIQDVYLVSDKIQAHDPKAFQVLAFGPLDERDD